MGEMRAFASKAPEEKREMSASERQEDYYKGFRSQVVLFWLMCNFGLVAVVLSTAGLDRIDTTSESDDKRSAIYLAVVLWSVAGLSAFKFIGAIWFLFRNEPACWTLFDYIGASNHIHQTGVEVSP